VSIVRIGMSEDGKFADGYDAIFGKKKPSASVDAKNATAKKPVAKKKPMAKKPVKKK
jgi:hypothetical protein